MAGVPSAAGEYSDGVGTALQAVVYDAMLKSEGAALGYWNIALQAIWPTTLGRNLP